MITDKIKKELDLALNQIGIENSNNKQYIVDKNKNIEYGDFSSNVAMVFCKDVSKNPLDLANIIKETIKSDLFSKIEVTKPGFINFFISEKENSDFLLEILKKENDYGRFSKKNKKYDIEYVSANPTGFLHIGHARNAVLGNCISNILQWYGFDVLTEYVVNDAGNQMNNLATSILIRYLELFGIKQELGPDSYHGSEIIDIANKLKIEVGDKYINAEIKDFKILDGSIEHFFREYGEDYLLNIIKKDLKDLGVVIEEYFCEKQLHKDGSIDKLINKLILNEKAYKKDGAVWLKTIPFGDDKDRVLIKSDGIPTYFAPDIVYHDYKWKHSNADYLVNVWGADHYSYITRMKAAMGALGYDPKDLIIICMQMVRLVKNGEEFKMSKRTGQSLTTRDLIDSIGMDAARWFLIYQSANNHIEIDVELATTKSSNNPIYYVQYAHARACQLLDKEDILLPSKLSSLNSIKERELINELRYFKFTIENAALTYEPYKLSVYLYNLTKLFHSFYTNNKILDNDNPKKVDQYFLVKAVRQVIYNALVILGITAPSKM